MAWRWIKYAAGPKNTQELADGDKWLGISIQFPAEHGHISCAPEITAERRRAALIIENAPALLEAALQALSRWPISLRGSALEKAVYEAQGLPVPVIEERPGIDLAGLARETFAVATPERDESGKEKQP